MASNLLAKASNLKGMASTSCSKHVGKTNTANGCQWQVSRGDRTGMNGTLRSRPVSSGGAEPISPERPMAFRESSHAFSWRTGDASAFRVVSLWWFNRGSVFVATPKFASQHVANSKTQHNFCAISIYQCSCLFTPHARILHQKCESFLFNWNVTLPKWEKRQQK